MSSLSQLVKTLKRFIGQVKHLNVQWRWKLICNKDTWWAQNLHNWGVELETLRTFQLNEMNNHQIQREITYPIAEFIFNKYLIQKSKRIASYHVTKSSSSIYEQKCIKNCRSFILHNFNKKLSDLILLSVYTLYFNKFPVSVRDNWNNTQKKYTRT